MQAVIDAIPEDLRFDAKRALPDAIRQILVKRGNPDALRAGGAPQPLRAHRHASVQRVGSVLPRLENPVRIDSVPDLLVDDLPHFDGSLGGALTVASPMLTCGTTQARN